MTAPSTFAPVSAGTGVQGRRSRLALWLTSAGCVAVALMAPALPFLSRTPPGRDDVAAAALLSLFCLGVGVGAAWSVPRDIPLGTWTVDAQGVTHRDETGEVRSLGWKDVEWVRWPRTSERVTLRLEGGDVRLVVPFPVLDEPGRAELADRVRAVLGCDFDLTWVDPPRTIRVIPVLFFGLGMTALLIVPAYWVAVTEVWRGAGWRKALVVTGWVTVLPSALGWAWWTAESLNPSWRRRLPKDPPGDLA